MFTGFVLICGWAPELLGGLVAYVGVVYGFLVLGLVW